MNGLYDEIRLALHAVWQRRWLALIVAWAVAVVGWLVVSLIPNGYASESRVFVQMQSILPGKIGVTPLERQQEIDRVRQTLASTVNLEKVVRATDLQNEAGTARDVSRIVEELRDDITIKAQQDNLFQITAKSSRSGLSDRENAKLARAVNQKLIDIFVEENLAGNRDETSQTLRFLDEQLAEREKQLQLAEQKRVEFEQKYLGLLPGAGSASQRMERAQLDLGNVEQNLISAQGSLVAIQSQLASTPASVSTPGSGGGGGGGMGPGAMRVAQLESQLAEAQSRGWTDSHPDMIALRKQLSAARAAAASEPRSSGGGGPGSMNNPAYGSLRAMLAEKQAAVAALNARKAQLQADLGTYTTKTAEEPSVAAEQSRLNRDYDVLKQQYDKLLQDREDIRLRSDVESQTDSIKFRVIDPPSDPQSPSAPNRPMLLFGVLIAALATGIGAAFGQSQLRSTYATAAKLERASGLNVLGSISESVRPSDIPLRVRKMKIFAGASAGLVACFALLMAVEFFQRGMVG